MKINYVTGDATRPITTPAIIAHICNNRGGWGAGFTGALSRRWKQPEQTYRYYWHNQYQFELTCVQLVIVERDIFVANMIAQNGYSKPGQPAIDYPALQGCLQNLAVIAQSEIPAIVHMPRIGTDRAGGDWTVIEPMIVRELCEKGVGVVVYDLER